MRRKNKKPEKILSKRELVRRRHRAENYGLLRSYGITLKQQRKQLKKQKGKCWICRESKNKKGELYKLATDHDHKWKRAKITSKKRSSGWKSKAIYRGKEFVGCGRTKSLALKDIKQKLKRRSVRGLICWPCNRALRAWNDDPVKMKVAAEYLERWQKSAII